MGKRHPLLLIFVFIVVGYFLMYGLANLVNAIILSHPSWEGINQVLVDVNIRKNGVLSSNQVAFIKQMNDSKWVNQYTNIFSMFISLGLTAIIVILEASKKGLMGAFRTTWSIMLIFILMFYFVIIKSPPSYMSLFTFTQNEILYLAIVKDVDKKGSPTEREQIRNYSGHFTKNVSEKELEKILEAQKI